MHKLIIAAVAIIFFGGIWGLLHLFGKNRGNHYTRSKKKSVSVHKEPQLESNPILQKDILASIRMPQNQKNQINVIVDENVANEDSDEILGIKKQLQKETGFVKENNLSSKHDKDAANKNASQNTCNPEPNKNSKPIQSESNSRLSVVIIHLMAPKDRPYGGYELLQSLLANGLRYGKMNIFHRHEHKTGRGPVWFSLASAQEPGTFDLPKMGAFSCPGLTLFLAVNKLEDPLKAFDVMLETVGQLLDDLGGRVLDERFETLSKEKVIMTRKKIREQLESQPIPDLFEEAHV